MFKSVLEIDASQSDTRVNDTQINGSLTDYKQKNQQ